MVIVDIPDESDWGHLPREILLQLATKLPVAALLRSITTCSHWLLLLAGLPQQTLLWRTTSLNICYADCTA